jgi:acyl-CoA thioesterase-1
MPTNYGPRYTSSYQKIYDDLKSRYRIGAGALMSPEFALDLAYFQPDGIHPNAQAQPLLLNNVWPNLTPLLRR